MTTKKVQDASAQGEIVNESELTTQSQATGLASTAVPDYMKKYLGDQRGNEQLSVEDVTMPRLEIVQSLSACREEESADYIEGAKEGLLYNNLTRELYGQSVILIPIAFKKEYLLWQDLKKGGGFGGAYDTEALAEAAKATRENPLDWEAVLTHQHICFRFDPETGTAEEIVVSMARSKLKASRRFNSLIRMVGASMPRFARMYKISGQKVSNKQNQTYYNYNVEPIAAPHCWTPEQFLPRIEQVFELVQSGAMTIDRNYDTIDVTKYDNQHPGEEDFDDGADEI